REHQPGTASFPAAFAALVVTTKTVLLGDAESVLDCGGRSSFPGRGDCTEDSLFAAELESHDTPRNLWLVLVRENFENRREATMGKYVRTHVQTVAFGIFGPALGRLAVDLEHEQRMMRGEIGGGIVRAVLVSTDRDHEIGGWRGAEKMAKFFEGHTADLGGAGEVAVVLDGVGDLREREQGVVGDVARCARWQAGEVSADFEVGRGQAMVVQCCGRVRMRR